MGRGNVCVTGSYGGLYYIDNDYFHIYRRDIPDNAGECESKMLGELNAPELNDGGWRIDEEETRDNQRDLLDGSLRASPIGFLRSTGQTPANCGWIATTMSFWRAACSISLLRITSGRWRLNWYRRRAFMATTSMDSRPDTAKIILKG